MKVLEFSGVVDGKPSRRRIEVVEAPSCVTQGKRQRKAAGTVQPAASSSSACPFDPSSTEPHRTAHSGLFFLTERIRRIVAVSFIQNNGPSEFGSLEPYVARDLLIKRHQGNLEQDLTTDPPCHPRACAIQGASPSCTQKSVLR